MLKGSDENRTENTNIIFRNIAEGSKEKGVLTHFSAALLFSSYNSMTYQNVSVIKLFLFVITK